MNLDVGHDDSYGLIAMRN